MSNYKGYLPGMNPNRTRKIFQDDDDRYYAYESSTGRFVNNLGQEVKTAKEAIAFNDKLDAEYKQMFPPQKSVGAKPFRAKPQRMTPTKSSRPMNGIIPTKGNKNPIEISTISPANIFPKSLNVKLIVFANSPNNSNIPTNAFIGPCEKLINFPPYPLNPREEKPQN